MGFLINKKYLCFVLNKQKYKSWDLDLLFSLLFLTCCIAFTITFLSLALYFYSIFNYNIFVISFTITIVFEVLFIISLFNFNRFFILKEIEVKNEKK